MNQLPNISLYTVAHWPLQGSLVDISGNALTLATFSNVTIAPGGVEQYGSFDSCLQGFKFDNGTELAAPLTALLRMPGPWTIQWLMRQSRTDVNNTVWCSLVDPAGRSGGNGPDRIGSIFTASWTHDTPGIHPFWTDQFHGSNIPTPGGMWWDTTDVQFGVVPGVIHHMALRLNGDGVAGHAATVDLFIDGVKQPFVASSVPPGTGHSTTTPTFTGVERFFIGGSECHVFPFALNSLIGDMRVLRGVARSDADILADARFALGPCNPVVTAHAIDGQTVRLTYDVAPTFQSPAGLQDAMNPANYFLTIDSGDATAPVPTTVSPVLVVGPTRYVGNGGAATQRGVDVHVDRPLVEGVTYRIDYSGVVGIPGYSIPFGGVVLLLQRPRSQRGKPTTNVDIANDVARGSWFGDDSGDVASQDAFSGYRKRVFRRLTTPKDAFSFLKGYGLGQQLKGLASSAKVAALKTDAEQQIMLEPETAKVSVNVSISPLNYLTFSVRAWTRVGAFVEMAVRVAPDGTAALVTSP